MKKLIKSIIFILLATMALFCGCFTGCFDITHSFIEDGDFKYYYIKDEDCYAIVGTTEQGFKQTVYVPTHFRGKEVRYTGLVRTNYSGAKEYSLKVKNCERLYFSYLHIPTLPNYAGDVKTVFFANATEEYSGSAWSIIGSTETCIGYVSTPLYDYIKEYINLFINDIGITEIDNYIFKKRLELNNQVYEKSMIKANLSFIFNYDEAPNEGYFFIDNYESESLIKKAPYEPTREGYAFAGWYKEAECINVWDFDNDRLPKFEYDSDGYVTNFIETKLYAKWIKV